MTLRADEVGTQRASMNTKHFEFESCGPPLVDSDWHAFCQAIYEGTEGKEWEELHYHYREWSQAAGAKKPSESQKVKTFVAMKAARDRRDEYYDPAGQDKKKRLELWEEHLKDPLAALAKALESLENPFQGCIWFRSLLLPTVVVAMACSTIRPKINSNDFAGMVLELIGRFEFEFCRRGN